MPALPLASTLRSDDPDLEAPAAAAAAVASPNPNLETTAQPAAAANMHGITGTFADPSHEAAFAAQLFRMAYPAHVLLMALLLTGLSGIALVEPDMPFWVVISGCAFGLGLICRVLLHRTGRHDPVRSQWMGSSAWVVLYALLFAAGMVNFVVAPAGICARESLVQAIYMNTFAYLSVALINGTHGLGFACKFALNAMALIDCLVGIATCHDPELDPWLVCAMGVVVLGSAATHTAELFLRRSYAENVQAKMEEATREGGNLRSETSSSRPRRSACSTTCSAVAAPSTTTTTAAPSAAASWRAPANRVSSTATRIRASPGAPHQTRRSRCRPAPRPAHPAGPWRAMRRSSWQQRRAPDWSGWSWRSWLSW
jgi:hypothetical protein